MAYIYRCLTRKLTLAEARQILTERSLSGTIQVEDDAKLYLSIYNKSFILNQALSRGHGLAGLFIGLPLDIAFNVINAAFEAQVVFGSPRQLHIIHVIDKVDYSQIEFSTTKNNYEKGSCFHLNNIKFLEVRSSDDETGHRMDIIFFYDGKKHDITLDDGWASEQLASDLRQAVSLSMTKDAKPSP
ncbi:hypothetical protein [Methylocystis iwaonis]|uniref:Uncharacterized protein n=1 Tax=Methylocystis iwaonis TaxID=2885079 RepID=A0ABN6VLU5_9HYPH|nr:hypothetical protein [Methylocystis iwaonis]BDV36734.1 hypothetical protein SS37A_42640 [Methylocystis iwaonis]